MYDENMSGRRGGSAGAGSRMGGRNENRSGGISFSARVKISMGIVICTLLLNSVSAPLGQAAAEKLDINKDYTVSEIKEVLSGAYSEAQTVMAQKMADTLEPPYTSSGGVADIKGMTEGYGSVEDDGKAAGEKSEAAGNAAMAVNDAGLNGNGTMENRAVKDGSSAENSGEDND